MDSPLGHCRSLKYGFTIILISSSLVPRELFALHWKVFSEDTLTTFRRLTNWYGVISSIFWNLNTIRIMNIFRKYFTIQKSKRPIKVLTYFSSLLLVTLIHVISGFGNPITSHVIFKGSSISASVLSFPFIYIMGAL